MNVHKVKIEDKEYVLNFNSYAVMMLYRNYTLEQLAQVGVYELNFNMIRWGLSENGRVEVTEPEVYDFIDGIGGAASEMFLKTLTEWITSAVQIKSEPSKKKEEIESV